MLTITVHNELDKYLWDGTIDRLKYYVDQSWIPKAGGEQNLTLDFKYCRLGISVAECLVTLMKRGINVICTEDDCGLDKVYDTVRDAIKGDVKYYYEPIQIQESFSDIIAEAKRLSARAKEYASTTADGLPLAFYVHHSDITKYDGVNTIVVNLVYLLLSRLSINIDVYYDGRPETIEYGAPLYSRHLENIFRFIYEKIGVPAEFYERGDKSIWICSNNKLQKLYYNDDPDYNHGEGYKMYYYPGYGWYTLTDLRRMGVQPLPGWLFIESIKNDVEFVKSVQRACSNVERKVVKGSRTINGSTLLYFIENNQDLS